jgi:hypothetical protein
LEGLKYRIAKKLKEKRGAGEILYVAIFLAAMILFSIIFEYIRVQIYASNVRDSFERAILTVASENYNEVYAGFREIEVFGGEFEGGPAGGGDKEETPEWLPMNDQGNVYDELLELLALEANHSDNSLAGEYEITDIEVFIKDAYASGSGKYEAKGSLTLTLPVYFLGVVEQDINFILKVRTGYTAKY